MADCDGYPGTSKWLTTDRLALSAHVELLASGSAEGTGRLWEARTGDSLASVRGHTGTVWGVAPFPGRPIAGKRRYGWDVRLWEAAVRGNE